MSGKHGAGKGDRYRQVDPKKYAENYEKIFGKKKTKKKTLARRMKNNGKELSTIFISCHEHD